MFKVNDRVRITKYKIVFSKDFTINWSIKKNFLFCFKNGEKIIEIFYEIKLLLSKLQMSYYPKPDTHITDKVKVVLDLSNYGTK